MSKLSLPSVTSQTLEMLDLLTLTLAVPRGVLASREEIEQAWQNLPRILEKIPPALRDEGIVRLCVAVASGLFDSAINYAWNATVLELRRKVQRFGLNVVAQIVRKDFDEDNLLDLKDIELLQLCLQLNLITEEGSFFLDQCREIRNNFSAAHPAAGNLDDSEFIAFVNRCAKYALGNEVSPIGVDIQGFIAALKSGRFSEEQLQSWTERLQQTHQAQRELLISTVHGIYCDPGSNEETRVNALSVARQFVQEFSSTTRSELINRHSDYSAKGDEARYRSSQMFFEKLKILELLNDKERHSIISYACRNLYQVHQSVDNFYNEPPFAQRLLQISEQGAIPDTAKNEFVDTVITCGIGNRFGSSKAAVPCYEKMVKNFSPAEVEIMLSIPKNSKTTAGSRIQYHSRCKQMFKKLVSLVDLSSVPTKSRKTYNSWLKD